MDLKKFIGEFTEYDKKQAVEMKKPDLTPKFFQIGCALSLRFGI